MSKYNTSQVLIFYMVRLWGVILRLSFRSQEYADTTLPINNAAGRSFGILPRPTRHTSHASSGMYVDIYSTLYDINLFSVNNIKY